MFTKQCTQCSKTFPITDQDLAFYEKIVVPQPTLCPDCRHQRRCCYRNEKNFFNRQCDLCKKNIVSIFPSSVKFPVYCHDCFWSDKWDPTSYGAAIDYSKSFFDQFYQLTQTVPHLALINSKSENSDYTNYSTQNKNCYMCAGTGRAETCYYCNRVVYSKDCVSCFDIFKCELCYECVQCTNCFNVKFSKQCTDSNDLEYCYDCVGCANCFGCVGLRHKRYQILNQTYTAADYYARLADYKKDPTGFLNKYAELKLKTPRKFARLLHCENCSGNNLEYCVAAQQSFMVHKGEQVKYMHIATEVKDEMDVTVDDKSEIGYEICGSDTNYYNLFAMICWFCKYTWYCHFCFNSTNLFGCVSMTKHQYCILNKPYHTLEAFNKEKNKLIDYIRKTHEWGEYFPASYSPFAYNESVANIYYPLTKNDALRHGWQWREDNSATKGKETVSLDNIPDITQITNEFTKEILACAHCGINYKVIKEEIELYQRLNVSIPKYCPACRNLNHIKQLDPFHLWHRQCMCTQPDHNHYGRCSVEFETTYSPEQKELVYCEECYNKEIY
ncbi:MAG: hypothetical protein WC801_02930 [Patescibacteria group bacterium]